MDISHKCQPLTCHRRHKKKAKLNLILYSCAVEAVSLSYTESKNQKTRERLYKTSVILSTYY